MPLWQVSMTEVREDPACRPSTRIEWISSSTIWPTSSKSIGIRVSSSPSSSSPSRSCTCRSTPHSQSKKEGKTESEKVDINRIGRLHRPVVPTPRQKNRPGPQHCIRGVRPYVHTVGPHILPPNQNATTVWLPTAKTPHIPLTHRTCPPCPEK